MTKKQLFTILCLLSTGIINTMHNKKNQCFQINYKFEESQPWMIFARVVISGIEQDEDLIHASKIVLLKNKFSINKIYIEEKKPDMSEAYLPTNDTIPSENTLAEARMIFGQYENDPMLAAHAASFIKEKTEKDSPKRLSNKQVFAVLNGQQTNPKKRTFSNRD